MLPFIGNGIALSIAAFAGAYFLCWTFRSTEQKRWHLFFTAAILMLISYVPESTDPAYLQDFQLRRQFAYFKVVAYFSCVLGYFLATVRIRRSENRKRVDFKDAQ